MSLQPPPTNTKTPIYNPEFFINPTSTSGIDVAFLNANYLQFPTSQGIEEFVDGLYSTGVINFNSSTGIEREITGLSEITFKDINNVAGYTSSIEENSTAIGSYTGGLVITDTNTINLVATNVLVNGAPIGGSTSGVALLAGGTSSIPQVFTGHNLFNNNITLGNTLTFNSTFGTLREIYGVSGVNFTDVNNVSGYTSSITENSTAIGLYNGGLIINSTGSIELTAPNVLVNGPLTFLSGGIQTSNSGSLLFPTVFPTVNDTTTNGLGIFYNTTSDGETDFLNYAGGIDGGFNFFISNDISTPILYLGPSTSTLTGELTLNGNATLNGILNLNSYTNSQIVCQEISLGTTPSITDSVLFGFGIGDLITNFSGTVAIGYNAANFSPTNTNGISIGNTSNLGTGISNNIAIGYNSNAGYNNSIAFGTNATSGAENQIILGTSTNYVKIPNYIQFSDGTSQSSGSIGKFLFSYDNTLTSWFFNISSSSVNSVFFTPILATNVPSLASQVYTGNLNYFPQNINFTICSPILQDTTVNPIMTNPYAQNMPVSIPGLYSTGMNTLQGNGAYSEPFLNTPQTIGSGFYTNDNGGLTATVNPLFPAITGVASLTTTTYWLNEYYIVIISYNFVANNLSSDTTLTSYFVEPLNTGGIPTSNLNQIINITYSGANLSTIVPLQLSWYS